jgi:NADPH:quinone reductase-like Zn-dependent oxidoreductase
MMGIHVPGSYADLVAVRAANAYETPADLSYTDTAMLAANGPIALAQLEAGGVGPGTWVLVAGASGALGSTLVALAAARGARVVALSRRPAETSDGLGAEAVLDPLREDLADALRERTGGHGVDVVVDNVTIAEIHSRYMPALAVRGRVVVSGAIGLAPLQLDPGPFYVRSQSMLGVRSATRRIIETFWEHVADGLRLPPAPTRCFPLEDAAAAHTALARGEKIGHFVLITGLGERDSESSGPLERVTPRPRPPSSSPR